MGERLDPTAERQIPAVPREGQRHQLPQVNSCYDCQLICLLVATTVLPSEKYNLELIQSCFVIRKCLYRYARPHGRLPVVSGVYH